MSNRKIDFYFFLVSYRGEWQLLGIFFGIILAKLEKMKGMRIFDSKGGHKGEWYIFLQQGIFRYNFTKVDHA